MFVCLCVLFVWLFGLFFFFNVNSFEGAVLSLEGAAAGMQRRDSTPDRQSAAKTKVRRL